MRGIEMVDGAKLTGELLDARFRLEASIGDGRFGEVFHGRDEARGTACVVRVLHLPATSEAADGESTRGRLREGLRSWARVAARATATSAAGGSGLARVFGFALPDARDEEAIAYVASEWVDGASLEDELLRRRADGLTGRSAPDVVDRLDVIALGLASLHAAGGVHGALHPRAIRFAGPATARGQASVLLDGGVEAALRTSETPFDVQTDIYQAPEQLSPHLGEVGPRTDVYALALMILELLADHAPIDASSPDELRRIALDPLERPTPAVLGIELGPVASDVLARATSLEPMARFDDVGTFWGTFKAALQRDLTAPVRTRTRSSAPPPMVPALDVESASASPSRPLSRSPIVRAPSSRPPPNDPPPSQPAAPDDASLSRPRAPAGLSGPLITEPMEAFRLAATFDAADTQLTAPLSSSRSLDVLNALESSPHESVRDLETPLALPPVFTGTPESFAQNQAATTGARGDQRSLRVADSERRGGSNVPMYIGMAVGVIVGVILLGRVLFATTKPDPPPPTVAVIDAAPRAPSAAPPDPYAFERALAMLDPRLPNCKQAVGPSGVGSLHATFDPSGAVTDVTLDPPYAGTSRGGCIAGLFRTAHGPTYNGAPHDTPHKFFIP